MIKVYGIKNCDTVKKSIKYLDSEEIEYEFVDLKKSKLNIKSIKKWYQDSEGALVNKRGTTFRQFKENWDEMKESEKFQIVLENPSLIKRPLVTNELGDLINVGYQPESWS